jgi:hypothetical protein
VHNADKIYSSGDLFIVNEHCSWCRALFSSRFSDELWNPFSKRETRTPQRFSSAAAAACENEKNRGVPIGSVVPVQIKIKLSSKTENKMGLGFDKTIKSERVNDENLQSDNYNPCGLCAVLDTVGGQ